MGLDDQQNVDIKTSKYILIPKMMMNAMLNMQNNKQKLSMIN